MRTETQRFPMSYEPCIGFDEIPPRDYRAPEPVQAHVCEITASDQAVAQFEAELEANAYGPIGADEVPPVALVRRESRQARRQAREHARARVRASARREAGNRAVRRVLRMAASAGVREAPTFRAWIVREFASPPAPDRLARLVAEFAPTDNAYPEAA